MRSTEMSAQTGLRASCRRWAVLRLVPALLAMGLFLSGCELMPVEETVETPTAEAPELLVVFVQEREEV